MSDVAIRVEGLGKRFRIGELQKYKALRDTLTDLLYAPVRAAAALRNGRHAPSDEASAIWAIKDISFEVKEGEAVGIIGRNGAGKSTLLKVLSRIVEPTEGRAEIHGRVGSLLEVGTGFHPELTGRENVYLNGAILGMRKGEIDRQFDEIVAFSEVEQFIDTPVKHYSSGMYLRLGFAVAAHLEPEVLIVDEVLAVGDAAFQKKCLGKMSDVAQEGRTVLFVSHNMGAIQRLCSRAILLAEGRVAYDGGSADAVDAYLRSVTEVGVRRVHFDDDPAKPIAILQAAIGSPGKDETEVLDASDPLQVHIRYRVKTDVKGTSVSLAVNRDGAVLFRSWDIDQEPELFEHRPAGEYEARIPLPQGLLQPGTYTLFVGAGRPGIGPIVQHQDCLAFELQDAKKDSSHLSASRGGLFSVPMRWTTVSAKEADTRVTSKA